MGLGRYPFVGGLGPKGSYRLASKTRQALISFGVSFQRPLAQRAK